MENMDSPRHHLRSSQSGRKVRFRHNSNNTISDNNNSSRKLDTMSRKQNISNNISILEKGLDLSLFEGHVSQDLVCAICRRVFVQPEVSSCQHVFCSSCLHENISKSCPTCCIPLDRTPMNQPPVHLRRKLLELVIHCDHKCGEVLPLGKLPRHVSDECPNTPVPCPYSKKSGTGGCHIKVKRCQLQEHTKECDWRPVQCEACGEKTLFNHLVNHQKKNRCVENRIRNQLVQAVKSTHQDTLRHRKHLEHQRVKMESHQRREELDHARRLQSFKIQRRQATWHPSQQHHHSLTNDSSLPSPSSVNDYNSNNSKNSCYSNNNNNNYNENKNQHGEGNFAPKHLPNSIFQNSTNTNILAITNNNNNNNHNNNNNNRRPHSQRVTERNASDNNTNQPDAINNHNVFVTGIDDQDEESERANRVCSVPPSRDAHQQDFQFTCKSCHKRVRESSNKPNSCRWHAGPIIELFGGTCYTCGRLDYQHGCMVGYHEM